MKNIKIGELDLNASDIKFDVGGLPSSVGDIRPIGGPNYNQVTRNIKEVNVQGAIEELYSIAVDPIKINGIYISTDASTPAAVKHVEILEFSGDRISEGVTETTFNVLGEIFKFESGRTIESIITEIEQRFIELAAKNYLITSVSRKGGDGKELEFVFIDSVPKNIKLSYSKNGISYTSRTDVNGVSGYGTWIKLGQEEKFETTFHYFKRIA